VPAESSVLINRVRIRSTEGRTVHRALGGLRRLRAGQLPVVSGRAVRPAQRSAARLRRCPAAATPRPWPLCSRTHVGIAWLKWWIRWWDSARPVGR